MLGIYLVGSYGAGDMIRTYTQLLMGQLLFLSYTSKSAASFR